MLSQFLLHGVHFGRNAPCIVHVAALHVACTVHIMVVQFTCMVYVGAVYATCMMRIIEEMLLGCCLLQ